MDLMASPGHKPLPQQMIDIYKQYKMRQKLLVAWLQENAKTPMLSSGPEGQKVTIVYLEGLTAAIVEQRVPIPSNILYTAQTMINMRLELASFYKDSDKGHDWCIVRFKQILSQLTSLPRTPIPVTMPAVQAGVVTQQLQNRFKLLMQLKDVDIEIDNDLTKIVPSTSPFSSDVKHKIPSKSQTKSSTVLRIPVTPLVPESTTFYIDNTQMATHWAYRTCTKVYKGEMPLYVAAYMAERAHIIIYANFLALNCAVTVRAMQSASIGDYEEMLWTAVQEFNQTSSGIPTPLDWEAEHVVPFNQMTQFFIKEYGSRKCSGQSVGSMVYEDLIPALEDNTGEHYYPFLLQGIKRCEDLRRNQFAPAHNSLEHSRIYEPFQRFRHAHEFGYGVMLARTLHFLFGTAQCFKYGSTLGLPFLPNTSQQIPNYRLKSLSFAQEIHLTLRSLVLPKNPFIVGYSTRQNFHILSTKIQISLQDRRFDLLTQHPLMAGSEIMLLLDEIYTLGFQLISYEDVFLGLLHVYNALRQTANLGDLPILETLCHKFMDTAFYGKRPSKKLCRAYSFVDDPFNFVQKNRVEAQIMMAARQNKFLNLEDTGPPTEISERGQLRWKDGLNGFNRRLRADQFSFFHRIYNQKDDLYEDASTDIMRELLSDNDQNLASSLISDITKADSQTHQDLLKKLQTKGFNSTTEHRLSLVENALKKEYDDPFPLLCMNLVKVWQSCYKILANIAGERVDTESRCFRPHIDRILKICDGLATSERSGIEKSSSKEELIPEETLQRKLIKKWKRAFAKEFDNTNLDDFRWKNM